jgi:hypothetical protein
VSGTCPVHDVTVGELQDRNIARIRQFYDSGPAAGDEERRMFFAESFVWHVPGDSDLSGPYSGEAYFVDMPARMQPLDEWRLDIETIAANDDLVVASGSVSGRRLGREITAPAGHVFRLDGASRIVEAWGWCSDQAALDRFFTGP